MSMEVPDFSEDEGYESIIWAERIFETRTPSTEQLGQAYFIIAAAKITAQLMEGNITLQEALLRILRFANFILLEQKIITKEQAAAIHQAKAPWPDEGVLPGKCHWLARLAWRIGLQAALILARLQPDAPEDREALVLQTFSLMHSINDVGWHALADVVDKGDKARIAQMKASKARWVDKEHDHNVLAELSRKLKAVNPHLKQDVFDKMAAKDARRHGIKASSRRVRRARAKRRSS